MMFDGVSKELYSLKQGLSKDIAQFRVHLLQQVQILQSEYPGRIQPEHIEEISKTISMVVLVLTAGECWLISAW